MENNRLKAKKLHELNNYKEALQIYKELWGNIENNKIDKWIGWEYADTLKKLGKLDEAIAICKEVYIKIKNFKYINDLLSWCLYEKYFKNLQCEKKPNNLEQIVDIANFIIKITQQEIKLPYEKVIWRMVKLYKNPFNACEINNWLDKLNVNLLSNDPIIYSRSNKKVQLASPKENWYYFKCKSLLVLQRYEECVDLCDKAMTNINNFHNNYDIWLKRNKALCIARLGKKEEALELLNEILIKNKHWSIHQLIFEIEIELRNYNKGLLHAYAAANTNDSQGKKINLYFLIGNILEKIGDNKVALMHYLFSKNIRNRNGWKIPQELSNSIDRLSKIEKINEENLYNNLKQYWVKEKVRLEERYEGSILRLLSNGKAGFIKCCNKNYYFRISSFIGDKSKLIENSIVTFSLADSFDKKKNVSSKEAIDIIL